MKKINILIAIFMIFMLAGVPSYAESLKSEWAQNAIDKASRCKIIPNEKNITDYTKPICRKEIAELILNAYENVINKEYTPKISPFSDTENEAAAAVYELGIMNGKGEGKFDSESYTTREEMAKIILEFKAAAENEKLYLNKNKESDFKDFNKISDWAKPYVQMAAKEKIINGYDDGSFVPKATVSWEMAIVLVTRTVDLRTPLFIVSPNWEDEIAPIQEVTETAEPEQEEILSEELELKAEVKYNIAKITWNSLPSINEYLVTVTEKRRSYYEEDIPAKIAEEYDIADEEFLEIEIVPNRKYTVKISGDEYYDCCEFYTEAIKGEDAEEILAAYPTTQEEAELLMVEISVPVWRLNGDKKFSSEEKLVVHNQIAEKVKLVFEEIYNGKEQFPINYLGGYSWRGGKSEHNGGTAIDINANENYCIYENGTQVGSHWKPYEDEYSITPYGDVIQAFEKYGFTWGGDAWRNPKDYMHFSYLGT